MIGVSNSSKFVEIRRNSAKFEIYQNMSSFWNKFGARREYRGMW